MAHLQTWFGLLPSDIATILPGSETLDKRLFQVNRWTDAKMWFKRNQTAIQL